MTLTVFQIFGCIGSFLAGLVAFIQFINSRRNSDSASDEGKIFSVVINLSLILFTFILGYQLLMDIKPTLTDYCTHILVTPDGNFKAIKVENGKNIHYKVLSVEDNSVNFLTKAQYETPNDVKAATFSPDSREFAAAYHYGHDGGYTWIGIWNVKTGELVRSIRRENWVTKLCFVFKDSKQ